ncbi:hypothetical protein [Streptomyces albipurpureus]|uniref:Uncharacterized protein n=1 Tax=Streptomyces albipurpureus TaxID=2897419 RepID=A0ABT0V1I1_9ACTN|nr:hypothetical protein [Streptomyces sp. CWNU-1]MCM2393251.1 hypothetical protein [Streptomyces sp. CWNU-1]
MNYFPFVGIGPGHDWQHFSEPRQVQGGQWPKLEAALAVVNRDLAATLPGQDELILMLVPSAGPMTRDATDGDQIYVALPDGRWQGNSVNACDLEEGDPPEPDDAALVLSVVADAAQETIIELLRQVWPICSTHHIGMHPRPAGTTDNWYQGETDTVGPPVWWCRGNRHGTFHDVSLVGELAATLPGKQRRALRRSERKRDRRR